MMLFTIVHLIAICSGALLLANAGVLDNRNATTHWSRASQVSHQFPDVNWEIDSLFVKSENIYTSAGVTTWIDLSLAIIKQDHGPECALHVARELVVQMQRPGNQSQYSGPLDAQFNTAGRLSKLITAIIEKPEYNWTVAQMADVANLTPRTLARHFKEQLGSSPRQYVEKIRVGKACDLIATGVSRNDIIKHCGLGNHQRLHRAFARQTGTTIEEFLH